MRLLLGEKRGVFREGLKVIYPEEQYLLKSSIAVTRKDRVAGLSGQSAAFAQGKLSCVVQLCRSWLGVD
jgi:hypothetical protein